MEIHLPDQTHREAQEDVAVDGEYIGTSGLFRSWSICWAESLRLGKEEEKELELKKKAQMLTFPKAQNHRIIQVERTSGGVLVQLLARS